jgi:hypothetical protein
MYQTRGRAMFGFGPGLLGPLNVYDVYILILITLEQMDKHQSP